MDRVSVRDKHPGAISVMSFDVFRHAAEYGTFKRGISSSVWYRLTRSQASFENIAMPMACSFSNIFFFGAIVF